MSRRWLLNLILFGVVAILGVWLYGHSDKPVTQDTTYPVSTLSARQIESITVEFASARKPVVLKKMNGRWMLMEARPLRANSLLINQLLQLLTYRSNERFPAQNLARFGLDRPVLKLNFGSEVFAFGTHHPVTREQYVAYRDAVYLVPSQYADIAATQDVEFLDKRLLTDQDAIVGFDFSTLEQWQKTGLKLDYAARKWQVSVQQARPDQQELQDWFEMGWRHVAAKTVTFYTPSSRDVYPHVDVKLGNGRVVRFDKIQESDDLLLGRPDEGLIYHLPQDLGFGLLNPPIGYTPQ